MGSSQYTDRFQVAKRRRALRERAVAYLGGKCQNGNCGYAGSPAAFDFHHPDPREKDFAISDRMSSWAKIKPELDKCFLLCARCHREVHDGLLPRFLVDPDAMRGMIDVDDADLEAPPFGDDDAPELVEDEPQIGSRGVGESFERDHGVELDHDRTVGGPGVPGQLP